jgi:hypothetical protein
MEQRFVQAQPYPWPFDGDLRTENTALLVVDMQTDFRGVGGFIDRMGVDIQLTRAAIEPIRALLAALLWRTLARGIQRGLFTVQGSGTKTDAFRYWLASAGHPPQSQA